MPELKQVQQEIQQLGTQLKGIMDEQSGKYVDLEGQVKEQLSKINERITNAEVIINRKAAAATVTYDPDKKTYTEDQMSHKKAFVDDYLRKGKDIILPESVKALSVDDDTQGGYLVPKVMRDTIIDRLRDESPIRGIASVQTISRGSSFAVPIEEDPDWGSGWVGEREARPNTANASIGITDIPVHEMYAMPIVTRRMLEDPAIDIEAWVSRKITDRFARTEGSAFVSGDGHKKPIGILTSNKVSSYSGTLGSTAQFDALINMMAQPRNAYQQNARWLMNRFTVAYLRTLKDQEGQYLWQPGIQPGMPSTILGKEYTIADHMPNAITAGGSLITGNTPIVYGDFRAGYLIVDKTSMVVIRDEVTMKPFILYYTTKRVGGDIIDDQALVKLTLQ